MTIDTKFAPGDEVWMMKDNQAFQTKISRSYVTSQTNYAEGGMSHLIQYEVPLADERVDEACLFANKADLLASL